VGTLVVEDMDVAPRAYPEPKPAELTRLRGFSRRFADYAALEASLLSFGYAQPRIDIWKKFGRVFPARDGQGWWTGVNPMARHLACKTILNSTDGAQALQTLAALNAFPVHLWVAGKGSACQRSGPGSLREMQLALPSVNTLHFPSSGHSIHNAELEQTVQLLKVYVDELERRTARSRSA
jgi:hypothetical protein